MLQTIHKKYLACILFAVSVLLFARTASFKAVWDDERGYFTARNQYIMGTGVSPFWENHAGMYIPLTYTTWAVVKNFFSPHGFDPAPFHLLNVLIHGFNGILLFYLLLLLFKKNSSAFFGSLLFLIHPLQVESVAWISEFRGLYSTFFCFISLLIFFRQLEHATSSVLKTTGYWMAFVFYLLALLAKPSGIVLPLLIVVIGWRFYKGKLSGILKAMSIWLVPAILLAVLLLIHDPSNTVSFGNRFLIAGFTLVFYIQKIIFPYPLVACYSYTPEVVSNSMLSYAAVLIASGIFIFLFLKRHRFPYLYLAFLIVFICILPVLGLVPFVYQTYSTVADRYVYMGMMGVSLLVASLTPAIEKYGIAKWAGAIVVLLLTFLTAKQTSTWKDEFALWDHNLRFYNSSAVIHYNRGVQYSLQRNFEEAVHDYTNALAKDDRYLNALFNRANAYENLGEASHAMKDYNRYIQLDAKDGAVYYKRSYLFFKEGRLDEALDDLQRAEELGFPVERRYKETLLNARFK